MSDMPSDFWDRVAREVAKLVVERSPMFRMPDDEKAECSVSPAQFMAEYKRPLMGGERVGNPLLDEVRRKFAPVNKDAELNDVKHPANT